MAPILLIDDDEQLRKMVEAMLTAAGHVVTTAGDGEEGVQRFRAKPADLVITDLVMPNEEGSETIRKLRSDHPDLGTIVMSGGASFSGIWLAMAAKLGATRTLPKPFTIPQLTETVAAVLALYPAHAAAP